MAVFYKAKGFSYFGGITVINSLQLEAINGNPNRFYGWGGEDSALEARLKYHKVRIDTAPYGCTILTEGHFRDKGNENPSKSNRAEIKRESQGQRQAMDDGFSSLEYNKTHIDS